MAGALGEISTSLGKLHASKVIHQPKWKKALGAAILAALLAAGVWNGAAGTSGERTDSLRRQVVESVAVVPLRAPGGDTQASDAAQMLVEELNAALGKAGFRVAATAKGMAVVEGEDPQAVGNRLSVDAVLQGTVRMQGNRLRVRLELVSTANGFQLWNEAFTVESAEVLQGPEKTAEEIARRIREGTLRQ